MEEKEFIEKCIEVGGTIIKDKFLGRDVIACELLNFDDYEEFLNWLRKKRIRGNKIYRVKIEFPEPPYTYYGTADSYDNTMEVWLTVEKNLGSPETLEDAIRRVEDIDEAINKAIEKTEKELEERNKKGVEIEIGFDPTYEYYYTKATIGQKNPEKIKLKELEKITEEAVNIAEDKFFESLK